MAVWTSPDWSLPVETTNYLDVLDYIDFRLDDVAQGLSGSVATSYTNLPINSIRWNASNSKWEKLTTLPNTWTDLVATYAISISGTSSNVTGTVLPNKGGTGIITYTIGDLLYASAATTISKLAAVATGKVLLSAGVATAPVWGSVDLDTHTTGILSVQKGGTGISSITGLVYGNGTSDFSSAATYISIDTSTSLVTIAGGLKVSGNSLQSSSATAITLSGSNVTVAGDLTVSGNDILSSSATAITLSGSSVTIVGDLTVSGNDIKSSTATAITLSDSNVTVAGSLSSGALSVTGNISATGDITSSSDIALKSNIKTIDNALDKVKLLRGVYFDKDAKTHIGVIAQETEAVFPEVVCSDSKYKSVAYGNLVGALIEAIKELNNKVERLENAG